MMKKAFYYAAITRFFLLSCEGSSNDFDYTQTLQMVTETEIVQDYFTNIQNGSFQFFLTTDCLTIIEEDSPFGISGTCWAQNPDAPYGLIALPQHIGEESDAYTGYPLSDDNGNSVTWHLRPNEAIVLVGVTPPKCRYFGFTNYLYSRYSSPDFEPDSSLSQGLAQISGRACLPGTENERCEYFASVSDTVNLDRGLNMPNDDSKFNTTFALILSPSLTATELATQALQQAQVPSDRISSFLFPGEDLFLGDNTTADTFTTILRTAFYDDDEDKLQFFNSTPFRVMRMELIANETNVLAEKVPYIARETDIQTDATPAKLSLEEMKDATVSLAALVLANMTSEEGLEAWEVAVSNLVNGEQDTGDDCVAMGQRCLADCRDTLYPYSISIYNRNALCTDFDDIFCGRHKHHVGHAALCSFGHKLQSGNESLFCTTIDRGILTNDEDDTIVVVGVNHHLANMSAYSSLAIYDQTYLWGVTGVGDTTLAGSANKYVSPNDLDVNPILKQALPYLYAYKIKRQCDPTEEGVNCISIASSPTTDNYQLYIPLAHSIGFAERMYDNPVSHVGPSVNEIVMPIQVHIKKRMAN